MSARRFAVMCRLAGSALLIVYCCGCGKNVSDMASSVKDAASQGLDKARQTAGDVTQSVSDAARGTASTLGEKAGLAGDFELNVGHAVKTDACYVQLIALGAERPAVLQLQSYREASRESFPSVFARAELTTADFASLIGQTIEVQLFVKPQADAPTLYTRDAPAQLKIGSMDAGLVRGEIISGSLATTAAGPLTPVTGSFRAVMP